MSVDELRERVEEIVALTIADMTVHGGVPGLDALSEAITKAVFSEIEATGWRLVTIREDSAGRQSRTCFCEHGVPIKRIGIPVCALCAEFEDEGAYTPRVNGKPFRCDCGCNVFSRWGLFYKCNGCQSWYEGE